MTAAQVLRELKRVDVALKRVRRVKAKRRSRGASPVAAADEVCVASPTVREYSGGSRGGRRSTTAHHPAGDYRAPMERTAATTRCRRRVTLCALEMSDQCARVVVLPPPSRRVPCEVLVELH